MMASRYSVAQSSSVAGVTRGVDCLRRRVAAHGAAGIKERLDQLRQELGGCRPIYEQCLGRSANPCAAHLGVEHDFARHREISILVHVGVANPFEVRKHRHASLFLHARNEALSAAGYDDVDVAVKPFQHMANGFPICRRHELDRRFW